MESACADWFVVNATGDGTIVFGPSIEFAAARNGTRALLFVGSRLNSPSVVGVGTKRNTPGLTDENGESG